VLHGILDLLQATLIEDIKQPLTLTETAGTYDVLVNVHGGGLSGQAGANDDTTFSWN
jgi:ribosomal protein S9